LHHRRSEPAEHDELAVLGAATVGRVGRRTHDGGDLLIGKRNATAIGTLVRALQRLRHAGAAAKRLQARARRP
jgi:hypothetical protein